jgi:WD40 repeat protein
VYDGKIVQLAEPGQPMTLAFSPDGAHYAFGVTGRNGLIIYLDGVPQSQFTATSQQTTGVVFFSPDSKHFAYFCHSGNDQGVCVDGKFVKSEGGGLRNLTFSADNNHLFWNTGSGPNFRLFVDGRPVMDGGAPAPNGFAKETWQVDGNTLLLLSRDNTGYKRLSITPAPGSGLQSMLGQSSKGSAR